MQLELFSHCCQCGEAHPAVATRIHTIQSGRSTRTYHFCSEECRAHFVFNQIRRLEGNHEETRIVVHPVDDPSLDI